MNRPTARRTAVAVAAGLALPLAAALPAHAADPTVTEAQWLSDVAAVTGPAQSYLDSRAATNTSGARLAIVLDIDNTALASHFEGGYPTPATAPVLTLAQDAHAKGISVFFVSARPDLIDLTTRYNLTKVGYTVDGLYTRSLGEIIGKSVADFKTAQRKKIEANGYDIVADIGNNTTDLTGGYADTTYKLPDYDGLLD
ncbi:HAD family acid phosphatase [Streptomyces sp. NPDC021562]|uniref:HAD family acid phosphatase n=1 Tax=Streptomyces sp. NPDC021562 TaxID=3155121 RepID=UPI0034020F28